jgi:DNA helicase-2/ATP-dependent DNA helicase PcrA
MESSTVSDRDVPDAVDEGNGLDVDDEQRRAVDSLERAIAVLAGPGSGKTRVLSYRARRLLIEDQGARALLLTFTNKAAAEMKARALGVTAVTSDRIRASTFHTFGLRVLRSHGELVGIEPDFEILDREDQAHMATDAAHSAGVGARPTRWSYLRLRRREISEPAVALFGEVYEAAKREARVLDFDDLIVYTADLFEQHPEVAEAYGTRFRHLLVDEFQDTNAAQFAIVQALCEHVQTVSVFADDDQAIYRFAGAEAENIRRFIEALGAVEYPLTFNYRCREEIVAYANRLIAADPDASGRQMRHVYAGGKVRHLAFSSEEAEATFIAGEIRSLIEDEDVEPAAISVLGRAAWRATPLLEALEREGIPTTNWLGEAFEPPERQALTVVLSVLRATLNDRQARKLCELLEIEDSEERDVQQLLERHATVAGVPELVELRDLAYGDAAASAVVAQAQVCAAALNAPGAQAITAIIDAVAVLEEDDPEFTLEHLLSELALGGIGLAPTVGGGVKVASLHRTKGLQWPRVYIVGLENGTLPDYRAETDGSISQERRACFVGVCRAETHLTLTRITQYRGFQKAPSIFLEEMGIDPYD